MGPKIAVDSAGRIKAPTGSSPHFVVPTARTLPWPSLAAIHWERSPCTTGLTGAFCTATVHALSSILSFSFCFIVSSLVVLSLSNCPHLEQVAFFWHPFYVSLFFSLSGLTILYLVQLWSILVLFSRAHSFRRRILCLCSNHFFWFLVFFFFSVLCFFCVLL